jgi:hypothetical protein
MLGIRMNGIAVAAQRGYAQATILEFLYPGFGLRGIVIDFVDGAMVRTRIAAGADFHGLEAEGADFVEHGVKGEVLVNRIKDTDGNFLFCSHRGLR